MSARRLALAAAGGTVLVAVVWTATSSQRAPFNQDEAPRAALVRDDAALAPALGRFEQDGLVVELGARGGEGEKVLPWQDVDIRFSVTSGGGGGPLRGLQPLAWLMRRDANEPTPGPAACKRKIRALTAGRLAIEADVNLNEYHLVTLDENASLSIIDPQVGSSLTKTLGVVPLSSRGADFVLALDRRTAVVTLPGSGSVALADLRARRARYLSVEGRPRTVSLQPDGRYAWVTLDDSSDLLVVDVVEGTVAARIEVSRRASSLTRASGLAFRADSRFAFVGGGDSLVVIDVHKLRTIATHEVGGEVVAVATSAHSGRVYAARRDGTVVVIDDETHARVARVELASGVTALETAPDQRWLFALGVGDSVSILDTSTDTVRSALSTDPRPIALTFTETFAYVLHGGSEHALIIDLPTLSLAGPPVVSRVVVGRAPPVDGPTAAPLASPLPEGGGLLMLNVADRSVYHLMEGMSAPMGAYRTYPWPAHGLLLVDNTLRETRPGVYVSHFRAPRSGTYTVAFLVPRDPQIYGCLELTVQPSPADAPSVKQNALRVSELTARASEAGDAHRIELRLADADGAAVDLDDVMVLILQAPRWQWRGATRARGEGRYELDAPALSPGPYVALVSAPSRRLSFGDVAPVPFTVSPKDDRARARLQEEE